MSQPNTIRWYVKESFDEPKLRSPQPCARGVHCDYRRWNPATKQMEPAPCAKVHPGEEGTGRRLFPARAAQPACVRLTGAAHGYYERCWRRMSWRDWCAEKGIPYEPVGAEWEPVTIQRINASTPPIHKPRGPPPVERKRGSAPAAAHAGICAMQRNFEAWLAAASPEEIEEHRRGPQRGPDCEHCDPHSGCDGDHGDEMRDGFFIRKGAAAAAAPDMSVTVTFEPGYTLGLGAAGCSPGCSCVWGTWCMDRIADEARQEEESLATRRTLHADPSAHHTREVTLGPKWYDSKTPVGAMAQALMASDKLEKVWHPMLQTIVESSTPEELSVPLGPADIANIETTPHHYATHVVDRYGRSN